MRVALISSSSGSRGGGELYLYNLARGLAEMGTEVLPVMAAHPRMDELAERLGDVGPVLRIAYQNTYDRRLRSVGAVWAHRQIRQLSRTLGQLPVDVLHVNKQNLEDGLDLLLAADRSRLPSVATIHVTRTMRDLRAAAGDWRDSVSVRTLQHVSTEMIAISQAGLSDLVKLGVARKRLHRIWNGVSAANPGDRAEIRRCWNCQPDDFVLGCVARIEPQKNPLFLPRLLAQLPDNLRLVWIGDGSLRGPMEQCIHAAGVADRVILPGWQHDARTQMAGFDAFVLPSLYEGFPFAILEAMAAGLPCIVSDVDGVAEAVTDGETGLLCPPDDAAGWVAALRRCLAEPQASAAMGRRAQARFQQRFSVEAMSQATLSLYEQVIPSQKSPRSPGQSLLT